MRAEDFKERWLREKYLLLERSPESHDRIVSILEEDSEDPGQRAELERLLEHGLAQTPSPDSRSAAARAIWSRLEEKAQGELAVQARELMERLATDPWAIVYLKKVFKILAARQGWNGFLESSYLKD